MSPFAWALITLWVGSLAWQIVFIPLPRTSKRVAAPKCPVYRLDEYQRKVDRRGRPQSQYAVKRLKR